MSWESCDDDDTDQTITGLCDRDQYHPEQSESVVSLLDQVHLPLQTSAYREHECDISCNVKVDLKSFRGCNPFAIPLLAGWRRLLFETSLPSNGRSVVYVAPCGRSIRNDMTEIERFILATDCPLDVSFFTLDPEIEIFSYMAAVQHPCKRFAVDISRGQENQPVPVINFLDEDWIDPNFTYCRDRFPGPGVHSEYCFTCYSNDFNVSHLLPVQQDPGFRSCCDCTDNCMNPLTCSCQQLTMDSFHIIPGLADVSHVRNYHHKRLDSSVPFGVYECGHLCTCNKHCPTRVVQNGIQVQLQIFKTKKKGWGVRTLHDIPHGSFITVYSAQILSEESADILGHTAGDNYFANLDFIDCAEATKDAYESECEFPLDGDDSDPSDNSMVDDADSQSNDVLAVDGNGISDDSSSDHYPSSPAAVTLPPRPVRHKPVHTKNNDLTGSYSRPQVAVKSARSDWLISSPKPPQYGTNAMSQNGSSQSHPKKSFRSFFGGSKTYILDAFYKGNVGRFFNHSCSPNSFAQNVFFESHDLRFPTVAFFASRTIFALEEITWDYQYEVNSIPGRIMYCYCRSSNCRGRLI